MGKVLKGLEGVDSRETTEIIKKIFYSSNNIIKLEALKTMKTLPTYDDKFLFSILDKESFLLKKEALLILDKSPADRKKALDMLLSVPSPPGKKNKLLLENIRVAGEAGIKEAKGYLIFLSRRHFIWNRSIRRQAREVLNNLE
jgi:hypothetical protein